MLWNIINICHKHVDITSKSTTKMNDFRHYHTFSISETLLLSHIYHTYSLL